jgi:hypothetical protein
MDCEYILEMKKLELEAEKSFNITEPTQKFKISKAVPLSGLVVGCLARMENELNTVKELWYYSSLSAMKIGGMESNRQVRTVHFLFLALTFSFCFHSLVLHYLCFSLPN